MEHLSCLYLSTKDTVLHINKVNFNIFIVVLTSVKTGATHYLAQLVFPDKVRALKGLFVCNGWDLFWT